MYKVVKRSTQYLVDGYIHRFIIERPDIRNSKFLDIFTNDQEELLKISLDFNDTIIQEYIT